MNAGAGGPPRVLIVGDHFGYPSGVAHGVTTYFLEVLPALVRAGVEVKTCFLREPHPLAEALRADGIVPTFLSAARLNPFVAFSIAGIARKSGSTILHSAGMKATLMARMAATLVPVGTIVHLHDMLKPGLAVRTMNRLFAKQTDLAICVSDAAVPVAVGSYHVNLDRVRVVHNGIRLERFRNSAREDVAQIRAGLGIDDGARVLGMFARMYRIKGHRAIIGMMPRIVSSCPSVLLLLAGDGPERAACTELVHSLDMDRHVRFLGQRNDIPQLLAACDMVVMPSVSEGLGLAAIEALATGKPVVGFDVGGLGEVVDDGKTGWLVPPGDTEAFTAKVLATLLEPASLPGFEVHARRSAERFSIEAHVRGLLDCYREVARPAGSAIFGAS